MVCDLSAYKCFKITNFDALIISHRSLWLSASNDRRVEKQPFKFDKNYKFWGFVKIITSLKKKNRFTEWGVIFAGHNFFLKSNITAKAKWRIFFEVFIANSECKNFGFHNFCLRIWWKHECFVRICNEDWKKKVFTFLCVPFLWFLTKLWPKTIFSNPHLGRYWKTSIFEKYHAGHSKPSRGPRVGHPCSTSNIWFKYSMKKSTACDKSRWRVAAITRFATSTTLLFQNFSYIALYR